MDQWSVDNKEEGLKFQNYFLLEFGTYILITNFDKV